MSGRRRSTSHPTLGHVTKNPEALDRFGAHLSFHLHKYKHQTDMPNLRAFDKLRLALYSVPERTKSMVKEAARQNTKKLADLNRKQLLAGKTAEDAYIQPGYKSAAYARKKNAQNPAPGYGNPDLYKTGSFSRQITATANTTGVAVVSSDYKQDQLLQKYGPKVLGFTAANVANIRLNIVLPHLLRNVKRLVK